MMASSPGIAHPRSVSRITSVSRAAMLGGVPWVLKASFPDMIFFESFKTLKVAGNPAMQHLSFLVLLKEDLGLQKQKEIGLQPKFPVASIALKKQ